MRKGEGMEADDLVVEHKYGEDGKLMMDRVKR